MSSQRQVWVVPFFGQGHLIPGMELCKHMASRNLKTALIISSNLASSIPSSFHEHPLIEVAQISSPPMNPPPEPSSDHMPHSDLAQGIEKLLQSAVHPACVIIDIMMDWTKDSFKKNKIPTVGFFTSGACSAALEYAMWKDRVVDIKPGETRLLCGLPEEMGLTDSDLKQGPPPHGPPGHGHGPPSHGPPGPGHGPPSHGPPGRGHGPPPHGPPGPGHGPPQPGERPPWMALADDSVGLMINSCLELEGPFLDYLGNQMGRPVWGVGPLLPQQFWKSSNSLVHDHEIRANKQSNVTEDEVMEWLESKPRGSVLYACFGTEVTPSKQEFEQLADAFEASSRPFLWVVQQRSAGRPGPPQPQLESYYFPHGLAEKVGKRGLIVHGWAPQLLILSHPSTAVFLSHCGWNSTVEAIGRGVPLLAWPIRGDQHFNAKLVVNHLKVGCMLLNHPSQSQHTVHKDDILKGIDKLMGNEEIKKQAMMVSSQLRRGFPATSAASLNAFKDFIINQN